MSIVGTFNDITERLTGSRPRVKSLTGAIDALNDALAGSDQASAQTIEDAVRLLGQNIGGSSVMVEALTATENKTYTAPSGKAYSPVTVNVASQIGSPVKCMYEQWDTPTVGGDASSHFTAYEIGYGDNVYVSGTDAITIYGYGFVCAGMYLAVPLLNAVNEADFYDCIIDAETGKYTAVTELEIDVTYIPGDVRIAKFVIPDSIADGHIFVIHIIDNE